MKAVEFCRRHAALTVGLFLLAAIGMGLFAATHLGMDSDESKLISPDLPFRQRERHFDALFPQTTDLVVAVIDATTPEQADDAAGRLADRLKRQPGLFRTVRTPGGEPYFHQYGLLLLPLKQVQSLADHLIAAQPMVGTLAADPSLRGLFKAIDLALDGIQAGRVDPTEFDAPLAVIARAVHANLQGEGRPLSWQEMMTGRKPEPNELRRFVVVQPVLDYSDLMPGKRATDAIRAAARDLGLTLANGVQVRLTGPVTQTDDEFATISQGAMVSLALSFGLVVTVLGFALRSVRLAVSIFATLLTGLIATAAFAAATVHTLNPISVAFAVMFVGIAVDFGIQFTVRYRHERYLAPDPAAALRATAQRVASPLLLAAMATAVGFLAFVPTDYIGVSQLGLIAGAGMLIAVTLNLTLLPALLALLGAPPEREPVGFHWAAGIDRFLERRHRLVLGIAAAVTLAAASLLPFLRFDGDPLHLQNPKSESVATALDLIDDPQTTPYTLDVLTPSLAAADKMAPRLEALPEVENTIRLANLVPDQQPEKLAAMADVATLYGPTLTPSSVLPPPGPDELLRVLSAVAAKLRTVGAQHHSASALDLAAALDQTVAQGPQAADRLQRTLLTGLDGLLSSLRLTLNAKPVTLLDLPEEIRRDWVAPDGEARIQVIPHGNLRDPEVISRFAAAVTTIAPDATGTPVSIEESGQAIVDAFVQAAISALVAILLLLALVFRRLKPVLLVALPLVLAGLLTLATCVVIDLPINYANIISLPLLLGIGVAFTIYFVMNWMAGVGHHLQSSTARAVVFSAFTTGSAFASLAISHHPGTASMGILLGLALAFTLLVTLLVMPSMLAGAGPPPRTRDESETRAAAQPSDA